MVVLALSERPPLSWMVNVSCVDEPGEAASL
jgi:hypothetical protein